MGRTLKVENLSERIEEEHLEQYFGRYGEIENIIIPHKKTKNTTKIAIIM